MAEDIVTKVTVDTSQAESSLERLGDSGEKAFQRIISGARDLDQVGQSVSSLGQQEATIKRLGGAIDDFGTSLQDVGRAAADLGRTLPNFFGALATVASAAGTAMFGLAKSAADASDSVRDAAIAAGTTSSAFAKMAFAAEQSGANTSKLTRLFALLNAGSKDTNDGLEKNVQAMDDARNAAADASKGLQRLYVDQQRLTQSFLSSKTPLQQQIVQQEKMNERVFDASQALSRADENVRRLAKAQAAQNAEAGRGIGALEKLGVKVKNADGTMRDVTEVTKDFADAIAQIPDKAQRSAKAAEILGRRVGPGLVEMLSLGRKGIEAFEKEAERLGHDLSDIEETGDNFNDTLSKLSKTFGALRARMGAAFQPGFIILFNALTEAIFVLTPHVLALSNAIGTAFTSAVKAVTDALGPWGVVITTAATAVGALIFSIGALSKVLGPVAGLLRLGFAPFAAIGATAVAAFKLITSSLASVLSLLRLVGVVLAAVFGPALAPIAAVAAAIGILLIAFGDAKTEAMSFSEIMKTMFEGVKTIAKAFSDNFGSVLKAAFEGIVAFVKEILIPAFKALKGVFDEVAKWINDTFGTNITGVQLFGAAILALAVALGGLPAAIIAITTAVTLLIAKFKENQTVMILIGTALTALAIAFASIPIAIAAIMLAVGFLIAKWDVLKKGAEGLMADMKKAWDDFANYMATTWIGKLVGVIKEAIKWFKSLGQASQQAATPPELSPSGGMQVQTNRRGGIIRGPGTGTSDSILSWLSRGEGVLTARAVNYYGQEIVGLINRLALPKNIRGFSMGGIADALSTPIRFGTIPRFATGGVAVGSKQRPIILNFPDGTQFEMQAGQSTAERLSRYSHKRRLSSAGRKPSYYGGGSR